MGVAPNHPSFQSFCHSLFMDFPSKKTSMFGVSPFMETPMYKYIVFSLFFFNHPLPDHGK